MNRRLTNLVRFAMDELLPPIIRDSRWFMWPFFVYAYRGKKVGMMMDLKRRVWSFTPEEYAALYAGLDSISRHRETDLNQRCIEAITRAISDRDRSILDVGCGSGFLLRHLERTCPGRELAGLDVVRPSEPLPKGAKFMNADVAALELEPDSYDVITCCHVIEHLIDYRRVIAKLVTAARHRIIFVVPRQRPYYFTLDEHVNFFLFPEKLAHEVGLNRHSVQVLDGDLFYVGEKPELP